MKIININAVWCPACILMHKVWNKIMENYQNIVFDNYDYDIDEDVVNDYNPGKILPVAILIKDDIEVERIIGEKTYEEVEEVLKKYL